MNAVPDQIEKTILLNAALARVWSAISVAANFGAWFGMKFDGEFAPGKLMTGAIVPTLVDPEVARLQAPHAGKRFALHIEKIEPIRLFSFRWHPFAIDPQADYSKEPMTLVTFALAEVEGGVKLTITESGFSKLPPARRDAAFRANDGGWAHQCRLVEKYLAQSGQAPLVTRTT